MALLALFALLTCAGSGFSAAGPPGLLQDVTEPWWVSGAEDLSADYIVVCPDRFATEAHALADAMADLHELRAVAITLGEIRAAFPGAIPDSADTASIREALAFAYSSWRTAPLFALLLGDAAEAASQELYDLLPTPHFYQNEYGGWCDGTYAMDAWYGDVCQGPRDWREIVIGRLPIREAAQAEQYREKLYYYAFLQEPRGRAGFVVGDLSLLQDNENRRPAAQRLMAYLHESGGLDTTALYSYDFSTLIPPPGDYLPDEVGAGRDLIINLLDSGLDLVEFFGNTYPASAVTHTLWYDDHPLIPQFRASQLANFLSWPFAIFSHCKVGAFDEYATLGFSPIEDLVLTPEVGAVAAIGKGQMTYLEADEPISAAIYVAVLEGGGGSTLGLQVNGGLESYLHSARCSRDEATHTARMVNFIGDPALALRIPRQFSRLEGGFEGTGALPLQDRLAPRAAWRSENLDEPASLTRVVHAELAGGEWLIPVEGQRMLRIRARHLAQGDSCRGAWTLFSRRAGEVSALAHLDPGSTGSCVLSYWIRQEQALADSGQMILDLVTSDGRTLTEGTDPGAHDCWGRPYGTEAIRYPLGVWTHVWVRLDDWAASGAAIDSIVVRYAGQRVGAPELLAYLDDIVVGAWPSPATDPDETRRDLVLNGEFTHDADGDRAPDFWTGPYPNLRSPPGALPWTGGDAGLILDPAVTEPAALTQILPRISQDDCLEVHIFARGWADDREDRLAVRLRDLQTGAVMAERTFPVDPHGSEQITFLRPDAIDRPPLLELAGIGGSVMLERVSIYSCADTDVPAGGESCPRLAPLRVWPVPSRGHLQIDWGRVSSAAQSARLTVQAADGRCVSRVGLPLHSGARGLRLSLDALRGTPLPGGVYFLTLQLGGRTHGARVLLIR